MASRSTLLILALGLLLILPWSPANSAKKAEAAFTTRLIPFFLTDGGDAKAAGRLDIATRLEILERKGEWLRVRITGWHQDGGKRVIFEKPGKRILALVLRKSAVSRLQRLRTVILPDTEITWHKAELTGFIKKTQLEPEISTLWQKAEDLFSTRCTVCHQRRIPDKYTINQWRSLLKVMGPRTGLPKANQQLILKYLQYQARDAKELASGPK